MAAFLDEAQLKAAAKKFIDNFDNDVNNNNVRGNKGNIQQREGNGKAWMNVSDQVMNRVKEELGFRDIERAKGAKKPVSDLAELNKIASQEKETDKQNNKTHSKPTTARDNDLDKKTIDKTSQKNVTKPSFADMVKANSSSQLATSDNKINSKPTTARDKNLEKKAIVGVEHTSKDEVGGQSQLVKGNSLSKGFKSYADTVKAQRKEQSNVKGNGRQ